MKKITITINTLLCILLLTSCSYEDMMDKFVPKKEAQLAEDYLTKLREKDFEYIKSKLSDELKPKVNDELLIRISNYFHDGELLSTEIIGSQVNVINGVWTGNFTFEYHFTNGWNLANTAFRKVDNKYEVIGLNVYQTAMSQKEQNVFNFSNKSLLHYIIFFSAIIVLLFILISIYFCARTPIPKRKWLWIVFILFGVSSIQINWTTGQYAIQLLSINLFGTSAVAAGPYSPWVILVSFPLGAIIFWFKRKGFIALSKKLGSKKLESD